MKRVLYIFVFFISFSKPIIKANEPLNSKITIGWKDDILSVFHPNIPGGKIETWYLEAYCRPGSTDRVWDKTVIGHETKILHSNHDGTEIKLRCHLKDGVIVDHLIRTDINGVRFNLIARNPTKKTSQAHWAQPCIRVGEFTGHGASQTDDKYAYIKNCFVFQDKDDIPDFLPTKDWALKARYTPGQVWRPININGNDVNPRPLHPTTPYKNIIGCISKDKKWLLASVWDPCQELFQGVIRCIHSDFRIGGLEPGEQKEIRGKMYLMENDINKFMKLYDQEFPSK